MNFKKFGILIPLALMASILILAACSSEDEAPAASVQPTAAPAAQAPAVQPTAAPAQPAPAAVTQPTAAAPPSAESDLVGELEGPSVVTDVSQYPTSFGEAPQLATLAAGRE